jgi:act minimal PKS chain-length factor (CLF/KS beta)
VSTVVTGIGILAPTGLGAEAYWAATLRGESGVRRIRRFDPARYPATLAGEITDFDPGTHLPNRLLPQTDRMTQFALVAADWALRDAAVDPAQLGGYQAGVVTASASGGFEFGHRELEKLWGKGPNYVSAYQSFAWFYAVNTGQISIRHGLRGPSGVLVTEQAGGIDAIAQARRLIRDGTPLMLAGGAESSLSPWGWVARVASGRLATGADPTAAFLPFDLRAAGYVPGEGAAMLVLEDGETAASRRTSRVYGTIAGYGATFDPRPGHGEPGLARGIQVALDDAGLTPDQVDVVFADGAGVATLDRDEAEAITKVFGPRGVPVTVPKTMTGRLASGGAALDVATALLALRDQVIPPTINITGLDPRCQIDLVRERPRPGRLSTALVLARGHGGCNAVLILTR